MRPSLFRIGIVPRLFLAAAFASVAFVSVALVSHQSPEPARDDRPLDGPPPVATATTLFHLEVESVQPVSIWSVHADGVLLAPSASDAHRWEGVIAMSPRTLLIEPAEAVQKTGTTNALRIRTRYGDTLTDRTEWCAGNCSIVLQLNHPGSTAPTR